MSENWTEDEALLTKMSESETEDEALLTKMSENGTEDEALLTKMSENGMGLHHTRQSITHKDVREVSPTKASDDTV